MGAAPGFICCDRPPCDEQSDSETIESDGTQCE